MHALKLESVVLCGVAVRMDGEVVNLRRGTALKQLGQTPEIALPTRFPSLQRPQGQPRPTAWQDRLDANQVAQTTGAGRSHSRAGLSCHRSTGLKAMASTYLRRVATGGKPKG